MVKARPHGSAAQVCRSNARQDKYLITADTVSLARIFLGPGPESPKQQRTRRFLKIMKMHEYQAKEILAKYGVAVPRGEVANTPEEASAVARKLFAEGAPASSSRRRFTPEAAARAAA